MIKLSHKISVWILVGLMLIATFLTPLYIWKQFKNQNLYEQEYPTKTSITKERDSIAEQLGDTDKYTKRASLQFMQGDHVVDLFATYYDLPDSLYDQYALLYCYNAMLANYDFDKYPIGDTYLAFRAYSNFSMQCHTMVELNAIPFEERDTSWYNEYINQNELLELSRTALFNHDYNAFYEYLKANNKGYYSYDNIIENVFKKFLEIDPNGELSIDETNNYISAFYAIFDFKETLELGVEYDGNTYQFLTDARKKEIEDKVTILEYQLQNNKLASIMSTDVTQANLYTQAFPRFFLMLLLILVAGSSVSQEMATGSIKSLIIAPVKRWKIFVAKLMSVFTWVIVGSFLITLISTTMYSCLYGSDILQPYYYVSGGEVKTIPFFLFSLLYFLVNNISLFIYILLAFMISCMTKNAGLSVGITSVLLVGNTFVNSLILIFGNRTWIDMLPSSNMNLVPLIFQNIILYSTGTDEVLTLLSGNPTNSLQFSIIYLVVLAGTILLIAYDAFVKKDIQ